MEVLQILNKTKSMTRTKYDSTLKESGMRREHSQHDTNKKMMMMMMPWKLVNALKSLYMDSLFIDFVT